MKEILALDLPRKWWPSSSRGIVMQIRICQVAWSKMMDWGPSVNFVNLGSESYCHKRGVLSLTWSSSEHQLKVSIFFRLKQRMQVLDGGHCHGAALFSRGNLGELESSLSWVWSLPNKITRLYSTLCLYLCTAVCDSVVWCGVIISFAARCCKCLSLDAPMWCCCNLRHSADALERSRLLIAHKADVAWMHCCGVLFCCGDWWHNVKRMKGPVWTSKCYRCFFSASVRFSFPDFAYLTHRKSTTFHQCRWTVQQSPPWSSIWSSAFNIRIIRHTKILVTLEHIAHISLWIYTDLQTSTYPCILQSTYQSINIWVSTNDCTASLGVFGTQSWNTFLHEDATITLTRCLSLCHSKYLRIFDIGKHDQRQKNVDFEFLRDLPKWWWVVRCTQQTTVQPLRLCMSSQVRAALFGFESCAWSAT